MMARQDVLAQQQLYPDLLAFKPEQFLTSKGIFNHTVHDPKLQHLVIAEEYDVYKFPIVMIKMLTKNMCRRPWIKMECQ